MPDNDYKPIINLNLPASVVQSLRYRPEDVRDWVVILVPVQEIILKIILFQFATSY